MTRKREPLPHPTPYAVRVVAVTSRELTGVELAAMPFLIKPHPEDVKQDGRLLTAIVSIVAQNVIDAQNHASRLVVGALGEMGVPLAPNVDEETSIRLARMNLILAPVWEPLAGRRRRRHART